MLLADIHGFLDNLKAPIELVEKRVDYYRFTITSLLNAVGVDTKNLKFVTGSSYRQSIMVVEWTRLTNIRKISRIRFWHLQAFQRGYGTWCETCWSRNRQTVWQCTIVRITLPDSSSSGRAVSGNTNQGEMMMAIDSYLRYLDVDAQFGGLDQRKLFIAAKEWLPKLGYREVSFHISLWHFEINYRAASSSV